MENLTDEERRLIASALMSRALSYKKYAKELPESSKNLRDIYDRQAMSAISLGERFYSELPLAR